MGSTFFQDYMYDRLEKRPGIVVIHDMLMGLGFFSIYNSQRNLRAFRRKILEPEGKDVVTAFDRILRESNDIPMVELDTLFRKHYLLRWVMDKSSAQIAHLPAVKSDLEDHYGTGRVHVVDMGVADPWAGRTVRTSGPLRIHYGLSPSTFVVGIFGSVVPVKRVEACLHALSRLKSRRPDVLMLVVGAQLDMHYMNTLHLLVDSLELQSVVRFLGRVSREDFDDLFLLCDVILNLRYPTYKGMSAILARALAAGKPIIISDVPEWKHIPDDFCWRARPDATEVNTLSNHLIRLAEDLALLQQTSEKARRHYEERGTLVHMASQYLRVIKQVLSQKAPATAKE
jgi:glycosyltransferase involved in cell wall biosynthesis